MHSLDHLLGGRIKLFQPQDGYRIAIDAVLLAAAIPAAAEDRVLDLGSGVGAAALCLLRRVPHSRVTALESDPERAALAMKNSHINDMAVRMTVVCGELPDCRSERLPPNSFHHVMANPPYLPASRTVAPKSASSHQAKVEDKAGLRDWIHFSAKMVQHKGTVTFIHRADRLDALLAGMKDEKLGGLKIYPLWPKAGHSARRVLVRGIAGSKAPTILAAGLVLHELDGKFAPPARTILWDGAGLDLA